MKTFDSKNFVANVLASALVLVVLSTPAYAALNPVDSGNKIAALNGNSPSFGLSRFNGTQLLNLSNDVLTLGPIAATAKLTMVLDSTNGNYLNVTSVGSAATPIPVPGGRLYFEARDFDDMCSLKTNEVIPQYVTVGPDGSSLVLSSNSTNNSKFYLRQETVLARMLANREVNALVGNERSCYLQLATDPTKFFRQDGSIGAFHLYAAKVPLQNRFGTYSVFREPEHINSFEFASTRNATQFKLVTSNDYLLPGGGIGAAADAAVFTVISSANIDTAVRTATGRSAASFVSTPLESGNALIKLNNNRLDFGLSYYDTGSDQSKMLNLNNGTLTLGLGVPATTVKLTMVLDSANGNYLNVTSVGSTATVVPGGKLYFEMQDNHFCLKTNEATPRYVAAGPDGSSLVLSSTSGSQFDLVLADAINTILCGIAAYNLAGNQTTCYLQLTTDPTKFLQKDGSIDAFDPSTSVITLGATEVSYYVKADNMPAVTSPGQTPIRSSKGTRIWSYSFIPTLNAKQFKLRDNSKVADKNTYLKTWNDLDDAIFSVISTTDINAAVTAATGRGVATFTPAAASASPDPVHVGNAIARMNKNAPTIGIYYYNPNSTQCTMLLLNNGTLTLGPVSAAIKLPLVMDGINGNHLNVLSIGSPATTLPGGKLYFGGQLYRNSLKTNEVPPRYLTVGADGASLSLTSQEVMFGTITANDVDTMVVSAAVYTLAGNQTTCYLQLATDPKKFLQTDGAIGSFDANKSKLILIPQDYNLTSLANIGATLTASLGSQPNAMRRYSFIPTANTMQFKLFSNATTDSQKAYVLPSGELGAAADAAAFIVVSSTNIDAARAGASMQPPVGVAGTGPGNTGAAGAMSSGPTLQDQQALVDPLLTTINDLLTALPATFIDAKTSKPYTDPLKTRLAALQTARKNAVKAADINIDAGNDLLNDAQDAQDLYTTQQNLAEAQQHEHAPVAAPAPAASSSAPATPAGTPTTSGATTAAATGSTPTTAATVPATAATAATPPAGTPATGTTSTAPTAAPVVPPTPAEIAAVTPPPVVVSAFASMGLTEEVGPEGGAISIAVGGDAVYSITNMGLYKMLDTAAPNPWSKQPLKLMSSAKKPVVLNDQNNLDSIACGVDNTLGLLDDAGNVYVFNAKSKNFEELATSKAMANVKFNSLAIGNSAHIWAVAENGNLFQYTGKDWKIALKASDKEHTTDVAVGGDGTVVRVDKSGDAFMLTHKSAPVAPGKKPGKMVEAWEALPQLPESGDIAQIAVGSKTNIVAATANGKLATLAGSSWTVVGNSDSAQIKDVAVNGAGSLVALDAQHDLWMKPFVAAQAMVATTTRNPRTGSVSTTTRRAASSHLATAHPGAVTVTAKKHGTNVRATARAAKKINVAVAKAHQAKKVKKDKPKARRSNVNKPKKAGQPGAKKTSSKKSVGKAPAGKAPAGKKTAAKNAQKNPVAKK